VYGRRCRGHGVSGLLIDFSLFLLTVESLTKTSSPVIKGVAIGGLYGISGILSGQNKDKNRGIAIGITASALLAATGVPRALKTQKAVPMAIGVVGLLNSAYYSRKLYDRRDLEF
jgi:uncharacterized membrane protein (UPF0136 family)